MTHYAYSELFLALCVLFALWRFWNLPDRLSALPGLIALLLLGITAVLGAARFGLDRVEEMRDIHLLFNDSFSTLGLGLLVLMFILPLFRSRADLGARLGTMAAVFIVLGSIIGLDAAVEGNMEPAPRWHIFHVAIGFWVLGLLRMTEALVNRDVRHDSSPAVN